MSDEIQTDLARRINALKTMKKLVDVFLSNGMHVAGHITTQGADYFMLLTSNVDTPEPGTQHVIATAHVARICILD